MRNQIASTNGRHYIKKIDNLDYYPEYTLPISVQEKKNALMLEIGSGWGRWLIAGANLGYIPMGLDNNIYHASAAIKTLADYKIKGYLVISDLEKLPFYDGVFDFIWSFSAIQHAHFNKQISCLQEINRVLNNTGFAKLEMPNRNGIRNRFGPIYTQWENIYDIDHMAVRYYDIRQYREMFSRIFKKCELSIHSMLGIGILPEDIKYLTGKDKWMVIASVLFTKLFSWIPGSINFSDSLYITVKSAMNNPVSEKVNMFLAAHQNNYDNLNIIHLIQCPLSGGELFISDDRRYIISKKAQKRFPIENNIPILIPNRSLPL
jgi:ubiquinone/menaquinone biosynthesis C-methylase UbiE/uncharacterized protein YbaR (Trm112 family)